ncbi:M50 family metallopeptidase [candidate division CSSED10-310 bacterium]|uniref:Zinc metalloprotease n=1 Tax=candidate division CSSED10-310 bacterium TaxID=2855610 RepID=A0ABV6YYQ2_UNCC1
MVRKKIRGLYVTTIYGIPITLDYSWFLIFGLIAWSLSGGYFRQMLPWLAGSVHWMLGIGAALLLFGSILLHELAHSVVAKMHGINIRGITLHVFGGVAEMESEPKDPKMELKMAAAGPATSFALGILFIIVGALSSSPALKAVFGYLFFINVVLAIFNLIPGYPLDGGRIFRALMWLKTEDYYKSTRWATKAGSVFAYLLMFFGFLQMFAGSLFGGIWFVFIGFFLKNGADASYHFLMLQRGLKGLKAKSMMIRNFVSVLPNITLQQLVDEYILTHRHHSFPVVEQDQFLGIVTFNDIKDVPRNEWSEKIVSDAMTPVDDTLTICEECELFEAFVKIAGNNIGRIGVTDTSNKLVGYLSFRDLETLVSLKIPATA